MTGSSRPVLLSQPNLTCCGALEADCLATGCGMAGRRDIREDPRQLVLTLSIQVSVHRL
jgi:hypothetical protein